MSFAQREMEKYGWKSGLGLGKNLNGVTTAVKLKQKRSNAGLGCDVGQEFKDQWWVKLYNQTASKVQERIRNGKSDCDTETTLSDDIKKSKYSGYNHFIKTSKLTATGMENIGNHPKTKLPDFNDIKIPTDEELFEACGRTYLHQGTRFGLMKGKIARMEQDYFKWKNKSSLEHKNLEKDENSKGSNGKFLINEAEVEPDINYMKTKEKKPKRVKNHEVDGEAGNYEIENNFIKTETKHKKVKKSNHVEMENIENLALDGQSDMSINIYNSTENNSIKTKVKQKKMKRSEPVEDKGIEALVLDSHHNMFVNSSELEENNSFNTEKKHKKKKNRSHVRSENIGGLNLSDHCNMPGNVWDSEENNVIKTEIKHKETKKFNHNEVELAKGLGSNKHCNMSVNTKEKKNKHQNFTEKAIKPPKNGCMLNKIEKAVSLERKLKKLKKKKRLETNNSTLNELKKFNEENSTNKNESTKKIVILSNILLKEPEIPNFVSKKNESVTSGTKQRKHKKHRKIRANNGTE